MENTKISNLEIQISSNSSSASTSLDKLTASLSSLKAVVKGNVVGNNLKKVGEALGTIKSNAGGVFVLNKALKGTTSTLNTYTTKVSNATKSTSQFGGIFSSLPAKIGLVSLAVRGVTNALSKHVKNSNDYIENMNIFSISMGDMYDEAFKYAELVNEKLGIDVSEWTRNQAVFASMANGFGLASDQVYKLSKGLTEISYDLASLYNADTEVAFTKVRSALAGEIEPLRQWGFALDQNTLQQVANAKGIKLQYSAMTQSQKAMLRYTAIVEQATKQGAIGDMARTLSSPANAIRILEQQFKQLSRQIGNVFLPIIEQLIPYVQYVTKVLTDMISKLAIMVGFKMPTWDNSSWKQASGSIDEATESAKELKNATMGFDELNVISENTSSASGNNGYGADLGLNIEDVWTNSMLDEATKKVDEIKKKVDEFFAVLTKPLQVISFDNIKKALTELGVVLAPYKEMIGQGLWWFYTEVLVPLSEWVIEDVLPNFFKLLGEALTFAQPYIESAGIFIRDTLYPVLEKFGTWVADNGETIVTWVTNLAVAFGALYSAYKVIEFLSFIQQVGGVTEAFKLLTSAIKLNVGAKLIDKAETIILNALYAKDFIVNIAKSTSALIAQAGAFVWYNAIVPIATAVTTALSGAMAFLTSPIGLVITAIGLLVGAVIYLWNTNEDFRNAVIGIWEAIKKGIGVAVEWIGKKIEWVKETVSKTISTFTQFGKDLIGNIVSGIESAWSSLQAIISRITSTIQGMVSSVKSAVSSIKSAYESAKSTASKVMSTVGEALGFGGKESVKTYATGGVVKTGQMFIARENGAGAELVGNIGNTTAVMNNEQIVQAVSQGVAQAVASVMGGSNSQNITIELDGEVLYRSNQRVEKRLGYNLGL